MALHHIEETEEEVLPSQVAEREGREGVSPRQSAAEPFSYDPDVRAASLELQEMIEIDALPEAVAAARRRLNDAIAHAQTVAARKRADRLKTIAMENKVAEVKRFKNEKARREAPDAPKLTAELFGVRLTLYSQKLPDGAARSSALYAFGQAYRLAEYRFLDAPTTETIAAQCRDILSHAIRLGVAEVTVIKP